MGAKSYAAAALQLATSGLASLQSTVFAAMLALDGTDPEDRRSTFNDDDNYNGAKSDLTDSPAGQRLQPSLPVSMLLVRRAKGDQSQHDDTIKQGSAKSFGRDDDDSSDSEDEENENSASRSSSARGKSA